MQSITIHRTSYSQITRKYIFYHSHDKTKTTQILNLAKIYKHTPDILHSIWVLFSQAMKFLTPFFVLPFYNMKHATGSVLQRKLILQMLTSLRIQLPNK